VRRRSRPSAEADQRRGSRGNREVPPKATEPARVGGRKALGQHFLVDENLLGVVGRLSELDPGDVVLEVGPGLGVLTRYLADRVEVVHAVELDRSLEPGLAERLAGRQNVELRFGDALRLDLTQLEPAPTKIVSNLPYNIATPFVVDSLERLTGVQLWCVMVQREVADRFFARPSTKAYGAVSVLVQLAGERTGFHPVSRTVFRPRPNVDSALVAFRRRPGHAPRDHAHTKQVVTAAFSHRRKRLANSLELAGLATREEAAAALASIGRDPAARAEELAPPEFVDLAHALQA
jgi:16S rRNA (adenine1518-N6/adenine1519-N6)-dimethyltransferase